MEPLAPVIADEVAAPPEVPAPGLPVPAPVPAPGHLDHVDPRTIWPNEAQQFTPWLLSNAGHLVAALGIELELTEAEHPVGGFALDLIGRDLTNGTVVIVENQLQASNHAHLGQVLTYAAGTGAATIVWLTTSFRDEHRQALTWLNEHTDEDTHFFGVELQVVRIGDSAPAPVLRVVAQPNDWQKAVKAGISSKAAGGCINHTAGPSCSAAAGTVRRLKRPRRSRR